MTKSLSSSSVNGSGVLQESVTEAMSNGALSHVIPSLYEEVDVISAYNALQTSELLLGSLQAIEHLIIKAAQEVEGSTNELNANFKVISKNVMREGENLRLLSNSIGKIEVENEVLLTQDFIDLFKQTLEESVDTLLFVIKKSITMVYRMNDAIKSLKEIQTFSSRIDNISKQAKLLALNAAIKATKVGDSGYEFGVVVEEFKKVSDQISKFSSDMSERTELIYKDITASHQTLEEIATTDMTNNIASQEKLMSILQSLIQKNHHVNDTLSQSANSCDGVASKIQSMIIGLQFEDRNTQMAQNISLMLADWTNLLTDVLSHLKKMVPDRDGETALDDPGIIIDSITSHIKLSEVRMFFLDYLSQQKLLPMDYPCTQILSDQSEDDGVELF